MRAEVDTGSVLTPRRQLVIHSHSLHHHHYHHYLVIPSHSVRGDDSLHRVEQHRVRLGELAPAQRREVALPQLEVAVHVTRVGEELVDFGVAVHADLRVPVLVPLLPPVSGELPQRRQASIGHTGAGGGVVGGVKDTLVILTRAALIIQSGERVNRHGL